MARLVAAIRGLSTRPCSHRIWNDVQRIMTSEAHRIVYIVEPDTGDNATAGDVSILRIYGPGRSYD